jgi:hypothetical protein
VNPTPFIHLFKDHPDGRRLQTNWCLLLIVEGAI